MGYIEITLLHAEIFSVYSINIAKKIEKLFDMRPMAIEKRLKLRTPIYSETAAYGHMGRVSEIKTITFKSANQDITHKVETFTWEKLDYVKKVKEAFRI